MTTAYVAFERPDRSQRFGRATLATVAFSVGVVVGVAAAAYVTGFALSRQRDSAAVLTSELPDAADDAADDVQTIHKFGIEGVTPVALQMARGTCWVFAAVAVMEHQYRRHGIANGWLQPDEYVRFSEQVFGIAVLDACADLVEDEASDESCLIGDEVWVGNQLMPVDTQGGSPTMLYWLKKLERSAALPHSVCRYTEAVGEDHTCPGLGAAIASSPLHFETRSIRRYFDREDIKVALRRERRVMSFSTGMVTIPYLLPCTDATKAALNCNPRDPHTCVACPLEPTFGGVGCCIISERESNTMGGEFFRLPPISHPSPIFEGGHAMALVGYSDTYRTRHGFVGGYILKNSWCDARAAARGQRLCCSDSPVLGAPLKPLRRARAAGGTASRPTRGGSTRAARTRSRGSCRRSLGRTRAACARTRTPPNPGTPAPISRRAARARRAPSRAR